MMHMGFFLTLFWKLTNKKKLHLHRLKLDPFFPDA